jgi:ketosteroid isomerase-like protein
LNGGDKASLARILSDNPTWNVCPGNPEGGTYRGMDEVFGTFYRTMLKNFHRFKGEPEVFIDGGDVVTSLGFYSFKVREGGPIRRVRFSHTFKMTSDNRIDGVWQVCDSHEMREFLKND